jgi:hypothetical protein
MTPSLLPSAQAARGGEAVKVIPGKPSIWTLEQAHYLLASMHETNQGLKLNQLSATALDPNASDS